MMGLIGRLGVACGLIGLVYTFYHDVIWSRYEGGNWVLIGWKTHLAVALCILAIVIGASMMSWANRQARG